MATQVLKGGNTDEFYVQEGTLAKSQMQVALHPDVSKLVFRYGRWHHEVDYSPFKKNLLVRKPEVESKNSIDDYGMKLIPIETSLASLD